MGSKFWFQKVRSLVGSNFEVQNFWHVCTSTNTESVLELVRRSVFFGGFERVEDHKKLRFGKFEVGFLPSSESSKFEIFGFNPTLF